MFARRPSTVLKPLRFIVLMALRSSATGIQERLDHVSARSVQPWYTILTVNDAVLNYTDGPVNTLRTGRKQIAVVLAEQAIRLHEVVKPASASAKNETIVLDSGVREVTLEIAINGRFRKRSHEIIETNELTVGCVELSQCFYPLDDQQSATGGYGTLKDGFKVAFERNRH
jgi:hypothetical protein